MSNATANPIVTISKAHRLPPVGRFRHPNRMQRRQRAKRSKLLQLQAVAEEP